MARAQPFIAERCKDRRGRNLVSLRWGEHEIIMTKQIAENLAEWILESKRAMLAFESPGATAMAVEKAYTAPSKTIEEHIVEELFNSMTQES